MLPASLPWNMKTNAAKLHQKAPYELNATAPNVLPFLNSHHPAIELAEPTVGEGQADHDRH